MTPPKFVGKIAYFFGYPLFRLLIRGTHRSYLVVLVGEEILVTKNWLGFQRKWRLPGGGVHAGETDAQAVLRESAEEIGLHVNERQLIQLSPEPLMSKFRYSYTLFACNLPNKAQITPDKREILEANFVSKSHLKSMHISEEIKQAARLLGWF